jgi:hypothetical protein
MSQFDFTRDPNLSGTTFRTENNSALAAIASCHQGDSRPSYAVEGMIWVDDSSSPILEVLYYDGTDDIKIGEINVSEGIFVPTPALADNPSAPPNGFLWYNSTTHQFTGRIDSTNRPLLSSASGLGDLAGVDLDTPANRQILRHDGIDWINDVEGLTLLGTATPSSVASVSFNSLMTSAFQSYLLVGEGVVPATNATNLQLRFSTNNGDTWVNSGYAWNATENVTGNPVGNGGNPATLIQINTNTSSLNVSNSGTRGISFVTKILGSQNTSTRTQVVGNHHFWSSASTFAGGYHSGIYDATTAVNAVQLFFSSGNIATGVIKLYGVRA